jgi:hypothetical protein
MRFEQMHMTPSFLTVVKVRRYLILESEKGTIGWEKLAIPIPRSVVRMNRRNSQFVGDMDGSHCTESIIHI